MIDLFVLACVISRVTKAIETKGAEKAQKEVEILAVFCGQVSRRVKGNFHKIDDNDDELIKGLSDHACQEERYIWDTL